jgi:hypothetical protein
MKITGGCHCGAIRYEAEVDPAMAGVCHCTDCQQLSGTAFRFTIPAAAGSFRVARGAPRIYIKTADSGALREQAFCETCGSPIYAASPGAEPKIFSIRAGTIDQRDQLRPARQIWTASRLPWLGDLAALPGVDKQR